MSPNVPALVVLVLQASCSEPVVTTCGFLFVLLYILYKIACVFMLARPKNLHSALEPKEDGICIRTYPEASVVKFVSSVQVWGCIYLQTEMLKSVS